MAQIWGMLIFLLSEDTDYWERLPELDVGAGRHLVMGSATILLSLCTRDAGGRFKVSG